MPDPLDTSTLLSLLLNLLPLSSSARLVKPSDTLAALVHAIHIALDFRLIPQPASTSSSTAEAAGPSHEAGGQAEHDFDDSVSETTTAVDQEGEESSHPTTPGAGGAPGSNVGSGTGNNVEGRLPAGWNARGEEAYTFEYRHSQSAMVFRIRVGRMGGRIQIDGMAEDGEPHTLSIPAADILDSSLFPIPGSATASHSSSTSTSSSPNGVDAAAKAVGFKSASSVTDFVERYKREIIAKLLPGLQKDGYNEATASGSNPRNPPPAPNPQHQPPPARPSPLHDPLHPLRGPEHPHPASIGHRDLDPLGSLRPNPRSGSFNPQGDGGGMYMDFNHPLFDGRRRPDGDNPDFNGPGGSIQPPGARWDPVGPGMGGGRFPGVGGNPLGGGGVGGRDWGDELPPPGEFGPDLGGGGGVGGMGGIGGPRRGGPGGLGGFGGGGLGGGRGGGLGGGGGGGGSGFGGGMFM